QMVHIPRGRPRNRNLPRPAGPGALHAGTHAATHARLQDHTLIGLAGQAALRAPQRDEAAGVADPERLRRTDHRPLRSRCVFWMTPWKSRPLMFVLTCSCETAAVIARSTPASVNPGVASRSEERPVGN